MGFSGWETGIESVDFDDHSSNVTLGAECMNRPSVGIVVAIVLAILLSVSAIVPESAQADSGIVITSEHTCSDTHPASQMIYTVDELKEKAKIAGGYALGADIYLTEEDAEELAYITDVNSMTLCLNGHIIAGAYDKPIFFVKNSNSNAGNFAITDHIGVETKHYFTIDNDGMYHFFTDDNNPIETTKVSETISDGYVVGGVVTGGYADASSSANGLPASVVNLMNPGNNVSNSRSFYIMGGTIAGNKTEGTTGGTISINTLDEDNIFSRGIGGSIVGNVSYGVEAKAAGLYVDGKFSVESDFTVQDNYIVFDSTRVVSNLYVENNRNLVFRETLSFDDVPKIGISLSTGTGTF